LRLVQVGKLLLVAERRPQHCAVAADHEEDVVEVVRDPTGELSDGLEPLGLIQPLLELATAAAPPNLGATAFERGGEAMQVAFRT